LRWPVVVTVFLALVAATLAAITGEQLLASRSGLDQSEEVRAHVEAGESLRNMMFGFAAVALLASWRLGGPSALASGRGARRQRGSTDTALAGVLVLAAVGVLGLAIRAGHTGATSVWGV
jgi:hypothetical protein